MLQVEFVEARFEVSGLFSIPRLCDDYCHDSGQSYDSRQSQSLQDCLSDCRRPWLHVCEEVLSKYLLHNTWEAQRVTDIGAWDQQHVPAQQDSA
jgi:hypothetical protein